MKWYLCNSGGSKIRSTDSTNRKKETKSKNAPLANPVNISILSYLCSLKATLIEIVK